MTQQEFIDLIPEVLLYIVPGFFVLMIVESFTLQKRKPPMETILWSIFFSFLVGIILQPFKGIWNLAQVPLADLSGECIDSIAQKPLEPATAIVFSVVFSGLLGFILVKLINSGFGRGAVRMLNFNLEPSGDFWFETLRSKEGVWANVYMKNGMFYRGQVITYTTDPNDSVKMLTLTNICSMEPKTPEEIRKESEGKEPGETVSRYREIRNDTDNKNVRVLLKLEDILSIELGP